MTRIIYVNMAPTLEGRIVFSRDELQKVVHRYRRESVDVNVQRAGSPVRVGKLLSVRLMGDSIEGVVGMDEYTR